MKKKKEDKNCGCLIAQYILIYYHIWRNYYYYYFEGIKQNPHCVIHIDSLLEMKKKTI